MKSPSSGRSVKKDRMSKISLVIPVYNEEENILLLYERLCALREIILPDLLEIIFVDDHSRDQSFQLLKDLARKDPDVRVIRF
jgi:glycosyltransferase involved in cell wall biosynthesis